MTGTTDDDVGAGRTYYAFADRDRSQVFASSMMLMLVVNTALVGLFAGSLISAFTGSVGWSIAVGVVIAVAVFVLWMTWGYRTYRHVMRVHVPVRRSDGG